MTLPQSTVVHFTFFDTPGKYVQKHPGGVECPRVRNRCYNDISQIVKMSRRFSNLKKFKLLSARVNLFLFFCLPIQKTTRAKIREEESEERHRFERSAANQMFLCEEIPKGIGSAGPGLLSADSWQKVPGVERLLHVSASARSRMGRGVPQRPGNFECPTHRTRFGDPTRPGGRV